jgi:hypothetical protein
MVVPQRHRNLVHCPQSNAHTLRPASLHVPDCIDADAGGIRQLPLLQTGKDARCAELIPENCHLKILAPLVLTGKTDRRMLVLTPKIWVQKLLFYCPAGTECPEAPDWVRGDGLVYFTLILSLEQ